MIRTANGMTRWTRLFVATAAVFGIAHLGFPLQRVAAPSGSHSNDITPLSTFVYKVYLDRRGGLNRLRVLSINRCHSVNESILSVRIKGSFVPMIPRPLEGSCPWKWALGCRLGTYFHVLDLPTGETPTEVILKGGVGSGETSVTIIHNSVQPGLTICILPMYWYTDWTKLIFFLEWWKNQNVSKFIFYHQSYSKEVQTVLEHYIQEGIVEVISWAQLPSTEEYNPNSKVYRIGHTLAQNDCILRAGTEFVTAVDVDELILPKNGSLIQNLVERFAQGSFGSLSFAHRVLLFNPPLSPDPFDFKKLNYEGIKGTTIKKIVGPPKTVVKRNAVDRIATHRVVSFLSTTWRETSSNRALLLHCRYNYVREKTNHNETSISITNEPDALQKRLISVRDKIFPKGAKFNENSQIELGKCLASWRKTQNNCKAPVTACKEVMKNREQWIEATSTPYLIV